MSVSYNSKKIIPAPLVSIQKSYQRTGDGTKIGKIYSITVQGTLLSWKGSPNSEGTLWDQAGYPPDESVDHDARLGAILRKQEALRGLFSEDGKAFEIHPWDGSQAMSCYPKVLEIQFPEGIWVDQCPYTITLEATQMFPESETDIVPYLSDQTENWNIEVDESQQEGVDIPRTYRLTHSISAVGKAVYDSNGVLISTGWEQARTWVQAQMGYDASIATSSGVQNLPDYYGGFNLVRTEQIDKYAGSYFVTENWVLASGSALETFEINTNKSTDTPITTVSIQGTITGLENRNSNNSLISTKYNNALNKYTAVSGMMFTRSQNYSGETLNIIPTRSVIGTNPVAGTISYTYDYDNRPSNIVPGALAESITISDNLIGESFASIFVLGRSRGPVLQNLHSSQSRTRQLSIELTMPRADFGSNSVSDLKNAFFDQNPRLSPTTSGALSIIHDAANPYNNGYTVVFGDAPQETWDAKLGRYTYSKQWTFEVE
jgi:hypothetical protein